MNCDHNHRNRFSDGFFCEDCGIFFQKDSPTYRKTELLSDIYLVLHNVNAKRYQAGLPLIDEIKTMLEEIGINKKHDNDYEELIAKAEVLMSRYNVNSDSATVLIS